MSMILNTKQTRQYRADMAELAAYRSMGTVEEVRRWMPEPAPLPLPLGEDIHLAAGLLEDDYDPAADAAGRREAEQWHK